MLVDVVRVWIKDRGNELLEMCLGVLLKNNVSCFRDDTEDALDQRLAAQENFTRNSKGKQTRSFYRSQAVAWEKLSFRRDHTSITVVNGKDASEEVVKFSVRSFSKSVKLVVSKIQFYISFSVWRRIFLSVNSASHVLRFQTYFRLKMLMPLNLTRHVQKHALYLSCGIVANLRTALQFLQTNIAQEVKESKVRIQTKVQSSGKDKSSTKLWVRITYA